MMTAQRGLVCEMSDAAFPVSVESSAPKPRSVILILTSVWAAQPMGTVSVLRSVIETRGSAWSASWMRAALRGSAWLLSGAVSPAWMILTVKAAVVCQRCVVRSV